ncbi:hypothetical protein FOA43_000742 [Brettanomyces nanus]|uniref:C2H2-type domain-containing protein n=1 Tax=Eeniella nana TaxID=13502 RepID=A0A875RZY2_EENNA|nr:uncharacterized protein FOA43_000742 [Brettanomyces nanus]QPG73432.1 hypothetical protein FOA43_000742 [Brettanomyces nanus]
MKRFKKSIQEKNGAQDKKQVKSHDFFKDRSNKIQQIDEFNKVSLITSSNSKEAGFYCGTCRRKYKDNLKFLEHLNSKEHLVNSGFDEVEAQNSNKFTLEDIKKRLEYLRMKVTETADDISVNIKGNIELGKEADRQRREKRRLKNREKSEKKKIKKQITYHTGEDTDMVKLMGFSNFRSTK